MGIRDELQAEIAVAFDDDLKDAVCQFSGESFSEKSVDPVTEQVIGEKISYSGRGVLSRYRLDSIDGVNILRGDLKLTALTNEVSGKPGVDHLITAPDLLTGKSQQYKIISANTDPARAAYLLQLRRA